MGSFPYPLCAYCGFREAGHIPNGDIVGPLCMEPDDECCFDRSRALGWDVIVQERLMRLSNLKMILICSDMTNLPMPLQLPTIQAMIAEYIWVAGYDCKRSLERLAVGL